jgi:coenzyme F420 hydrogenase subunit beta
MGTEFLLQKEGFAKNDIKKINYRGEGWPGGMVIEFKNDTKRFFPLSEYYDSKFGSFIPTRCSLCGDHACELADISFGDAWLPEIVERDKVGTSIVVSRNRLGEDILQRMMHKRKVKLSTISSENVNESQGGFSWKKKDIKARFTISKLLVKKIPAYNNNLLSQPSFRAYLSSILLYSESYLASKRSLWWLLDIYCSLVKYGSRLNSKLGL